jgi:hypothetical protein
MSAAAAKWRTLWALVALAGLLFAGSILFILSRAH